MSRPSDLHFDLLTPASFDLVSEALRALRGCDVDYVLGGGWAVYAHSASIPSVDVDLFLPRGTGRQVAAALRGAGLNVSQDGEVELLSADGEIELWGIGDPDLGIPHPSYVPQELFASNTCARELDLPAGAQDATVPTADALSVTKLIALLNRSLAYRSFSEGRAGMLLGPTLIPRLHARSQSYYLRKAGKDLFDLAALCAMEGVSDPMTELLRAYDLDQALDRLPDLPRPVREFAADLADRVDKPDPYSGLLDALD